jgi:hypothetical protein
MKVRDSFVANSSSSSFIISHTPGKNKVTISVEIDLDDFRGSTVRTIEEVEKLCKEHDYDNATLEVMLAEIKAGREITSCTAYTDDGGIDGFIADSDRCGDGVAHLFPETEDMKYIHPNYDY